MSGIRAESKKWYLEAVKSWLLQKGRVTRSMRRMTDIPEPGRFII